MKISIIGAGNVGATAAQRIAEADLADIVLVDVVEGKAQAVALDLASAASIMCHSRTIVGTSDLDEIEGSKIIVVTAGLARKPGQSREDLMATNAKII
ncbi:MAG: malate dehydrogenase, partial [Candidatus Omnitrophica bacterium]|nr:malate dehydrogenase [Candidatus Omnitrophota bacterium]